MYFVLCIHFLILKVIQSHDLEIKGYSLSGFFQQNLEDCLIAQKYVRDKHLHIKSGYKTVSILHLQLCKISQGEKKNYEKHQNIISGCVRVLGLREIFFQCSLFVNFMGVFFFNLRKCEKLPQNTDWLRVLNLWHFGSHREKAVLEKQRRWEQLLFFIFIVSKL